MSAQAHARLDDHDEAPVADSFDDNVLLRAVTGGRWSQDDLIARSRQVRQECDELVRLYEAAMRARSASTKHSQAPAPQGPAPVPRTSGAVQTGDAALRKKNLLLMLIEELL